LDSAASSSATRKKSAKTGSVKADINPLASGLIERIAKGPTTACSITWTSRCCHDQVAESREDVAQTDGEPLPILAHDTSGDPGIHLAALERAITDAAVVITRLADLGGAHGYSQHGRITILESLTPADTAAVLVHEFASAFTKIDLSSQRWKGCDGFRTYEPDSPYGYEQPYFSVQRNRAGWRIYKWDSMTVWTSPESSGTTPSDSEHHNVNKCLKSGKHLNVYNNMVNHKGENPTS
jgi:hypothetical protein